MTARPSLRSLFARSPLAVVVLGSLLAGSVPANAGVRVTRHPTQLSLRAAQSVVKVGDNVRLRGGVRQSVGGPSVYLQRFEGRRWVTVAHRVPAAIPDGSIADYSFTMKAPATPARVAYRVIRAATSTSLAGVSPSVVVAAVLGEYSSTVPVHEPLHVAGTPWTVTGTVNPPSRGTVTLQRLLAGVWADFATVGVSDGMSYRFALPLTAATYDFRVVVNQTATTAAGFGALFRVLVTPPGVVETWGDNSSGEVGNGTTTDRPTPGRVPLLRDITQVSAGGGFALAVRASGTVWDWGYNAFGQLGNSSNTDSAVPVQVSGLTSVTAIAGGGSSAYALLADGTVKGWGANNHDQVINNVLGNIYNPTVLTPVVIPGLTGITAITGGGGGSTGYALRSDGTEWAWGINSNGQAGVGGDPSLDLVAPAVLSLTGVTAIGAGADGGYAVLADHTVRAWGDNGNGQLGNNTTLDSMLPGPVTGLSGATAVGGGTSWGWALVTTP